MYVFAPHLIFSPPPYQFSSSYLFTSRIGRGGCNGGFLEIVSKTFQRKGSSNGISFMKCVQIMIILKIYAGKDYMRLDQRKMGNFQGWLQSCPCLAEDNTKYGTRLSRSGPSGQNIIKWCKYSIMDKLKQKEKKRKEKGHRLVIK